MAARKRKGGTRRRSTTAATRNPKRRTTRRRNPSTSLARRRTAPKRFGRRRNPSTAITSGIQLGVASALVETVVQLVPAIGGNTPLASAARTAATGFLLGKAAEQTSMTRKYADSLKVAGVAIGAAKAVNALFGPQIRNVISKIAGGGMSGIGVMPPVPVPVRQVAAAKQQVSAGVNGIGAYSFNP